MGCIFHKALEWPSDKHPSLKSNQNRNLMDDRVSYEIHLNFKQPFRAFLKAVPRVFQTRRPLGILFCSFKLQQLQFSFVSDFS